MNPVINPLEALRDLHLPSEPGFWPPAPGWWIVSAIVVIAVVFLVRLLRKQRHRNKPLKAFLTQLRSTEINGDDRQRQQAIERMSELTRQFAITRFGRERVARLHGQDWLRFLGENSEFGKQFVAEVGGALADAPYRPHSNVDPKYLRQLLERWAKNCRPKAA